MPRNEWNRRLRTKLAVEHQGQVHLNVSRNTKTSPAWREREDGVYVPIIHTIQGNDGPRVNLTTLLRADAISEAATREGGVYSGRTQRCTTSK